MRVALGLTLLHVSSLLGTSFASGGDDTSSTSAATSTAASPSASSLSSGNSTSSTSSGNATALIGLNGDVVCTDLMCIGGVHNGSNTQYTLQSRGAASLGWMAIGFGQQMANSPMVIMWPNSDGSITLSQRKAPQEVMPTVDPNPPRAATLAQSLSVLSGSNPKISFTVPTDSNSDGNIIWAFSSQNPDDSAVDATLVQHLNSGPTKLDFTKTLTSSSNDPTNPMFTIADAASPGGPPSAPAVATSSPPLLTYEKHIVAHAILMVIGFLFLLPLGAIIARYLRTFSSFWFKLHFIIQWVLALPIIVAGFACGVTAVNEMGIPGENLNDPHKKWGVALFVLYFVQITGGAVIHYFKFRTLTILRRPVQNYFHAIFGIFIIGAAFYQVRTGFRTEWPLYTGRGPVMNGANIVWIIWLVLVCTAYFAGMLFLPRQYRLEQEAQNTKYGSENGSTERVARNKPEGTY